MKYSTVIFDFDYTLADATNGIVSSFNYAFSKLDIPLFDHESIKKPSDHHSTKHLFS